MTATATNLDRRQDARIEIPHARRGGFGFVNGCPCRWCGRRFSGAKARRRHERLTHEHRVPPEIDLDASPIPHDIGLGPVNHLRLTGDALRRAVNRRLGRLTYRPAEEGGP